jgi:hypothetical protein
MGVDYNAVGGIGIRFNEDLQMKAIELEYFTEEEWDEGMYSCVESLGIMYHTAGNSYYSEYDFYFLVNGKNLKEVIDNSLPFLDKINKKFNVEYTQEDLEVISELHIW